MQIAKKRSFFQKGFSFPLDYIQDGLTFCLDGEYNLGTKHGDCSNYVVDLINGIKVYPSSGQTILYTDKYFYASGVSGIATNNGDNNQQIVDNALGYGALNLPKTIEICMRERSAASWTLFYSIRLNTQAVGFHANEEVSKPFYRWGERVDWTNDNNFSPVGLLDSSYMNKIFTVSVGRIAYNNIQAYVDCSKRSITTQNKNLMPSTIPEGSYTIGKFGEKAVDIYSVRLYNRVLTESEVLYNQNIDKQRFNF